MKHNLLNAGMIASLVMAEAAPAILPNLVFAQADIRHEVFGRSASGSTDRLRWPGPVSEST
jgi:hypothetical protein